MDFVAGIVGEQHSSVHQFRMPRSYRQPVQLEPKNQNAWSTVATGLHDVDLI